MSTSIPVRSRNGASSSLKAGDLVELGKQALPVQAVGDGEPGRVVGEHEVLVPQVSRRRGHGPDRRAAVAPRRVAVAVASQRVAHDGPFRRDRDLGLRLQLDEVRRDLAGERLGDGPGRRVADAREIGEGLVPGPPRQLVGIGLAHPRQRAGPGLGLESTDVGAVEAVDDAGERLLGGHPVQARGRPATAGPWTWADATPCAVPRIAISSPFTTVSLIS